MQSNSPLLQDPALLHMCGRLHAPYSMLHTPCCAYSGGQGLMEPVSTLMVLWIFSVSFFVSISALCDAGL